MKLNQQLQDVMVALSKAPISAEVTSMLESVVHLSLGEYSDQRHPFQERAIDAIEDILNEAETVLRKDVVDVKSQRDKAVSDKAQLEKDSEEASCLSKAKAEEVRGSKADLAQKARAFRAATKSLAEAEDLRRIDGKKMQEAENKKGDFEVALGDLVSLKTSQQEGDETSRRTENLMKFLNKYNWCESMLIALPAALAKAPDARGRFDVIALEQLEGELGKLIGEQKEIIVAAAPSQEKCDAAVREAQSSLANAVADQITSAKKIEETAEAAKTCEAAEAAAQKGLRNVNQQAKRLEASLNVAEVEVELFEQGPRQIFKQLKGRSTPAPIVEEGFAQNGVEELASEAVEA